MECDSRWRKNKYLDLNDYTSLYWNNITIKKKYTALHCHFMFVLYSFLSYKIWFSSEFTYTRKPTIRA